MAQTAPTNELGHGNVGLVPWSAFSDVNEIVPDLQWPTSISTYSRMRADAQIASLLLGFTLPIRRYGWYIKPNGARDEVVESVANNLNLPIEGQEPKPITILPVDHPAVSAQPLRPAHGHQSLALPGPGLCRPDAGRVSAVPTGSRPGRTRPLWRLAGQPHT
jgi:hypothetical protein